MVSSWLATASVISRRPCPALTHHRPATAVEDLPSVGGPVVHAARLGEQARLGLELAVGVNGIQSASRSERLQGALAFDMESSAWVRG